MNGPSRVLVLGLTFKENVPDLRNSKVADLVRALGTRGHDIEVADPLADIDEANALYGIAVRRDLAGAGGFDGVVGAVMHDAYRGLGGKDFDRLLKPGGLLADIKGAWRSLTLPDGIRRWQL